MDILFIAGFVLLSLIIISFFDIKIGVAGYLAYTILVPIPYITMGGFHLGDNFVRFAFLFALLYDILLKKHGKLEWKPIIPFIGYFIIILCIIPFQTETSFGWNLNSWRVQMMSTLFVPFMVLNVLKTYPRYIKIYRYVFLTTILIAAGYGLFLTTTSGLNPYILLVIQQTGTADDLAYFQDYFIAEDQGRIFGRISSVFKHPMSFGLFLGLASVYLFSLRNRMNKIIIAILGAMVIVDVMVCGVRSCIGGIICAVAFYFIFGRNYKVALGIIVVSYIGYQIVLQFPDLATYLGSIADIQNQNEVVKGSSVEQRLTQLEGCLKEIKDCPIVGKGFGWVSYYKTNFGDHPVILAFESLIFVVLCNNGYLGILLWILLIVAISRFNHKGGFKEPVVLDCLLVFYISYSCITGEYGYMPIFLTFYMLMIAEEKYVDSKITTLLQNEQVK